MNAVAPLSGVGDSYQGVWAVHAHSRYVFRLSLLSGFTVLGNQKSLRDYFPISLIPFSCSYLVLPEALRSLIFFSSVYLNAVYNINSMPTVLVDIHNTGRVKGCQKYLLIKKIMLTTFIIQSSLFFFFFHLYKVFQSF